MARENRSTCLTIRRCQKKQRRAHEIVPEMVRVAVAQSIVHPSEKTHLVLDIGSEMRLER